MRTPPRRGLLLLLGLLVVLGEARRPAHPSQGGRPQGGSRLTGEVLEFHECNASSAVLVGNWTQRRAVSGDITVDARFRVTRSSAALSDSLVTFTKCSEYGANCEEMVSVPGGARACALWHSKAMFWTTMTQSIQDEQPPHRVMACPPRVGHYRIRDASLDLNIAARMCPYPLENSVWKVVTEAWGADGRPLLCLLLKGKIVRWANRPGARP